ncbi:hypothetical protein D3C72_2252000 [compost metagenome]
MRLEIRNLVVKAGLHFAELVLDVGKVRIPLVIAHIQPGDIIQCRGDITRHTSVQLGEILSLTHIVP